MKTSLFTITFFVASSVAHFIRPATSLPACGRNEVRSACAFDCEDQCGWTPTVCPAECTPNKCVCRFGYVRNAFNECVRHQDCTPETSKCPEDMEFHTCGAYCQPTCSDPEAKDCDGLEGCGRNVCRCKPGFVKMDGVCVDVSECPNEHPQLFLY